MDLSGMRHRTPGRSQRLSEVLAVEVVEEDPEEEADASSEILGTGFGQRWFGSA